MNNIKCIIIDDEPSSITLLKKLIRHYCPALTVEGEARNATSAIKVIREHYPQLVFMDIELYKTSAFDVLDQLSPVNFEIIFVTAFDKYAAKAFKVNALDYLLKPIDIDDLKVAAQKAETRIQEKQVSERLNTILNHTLTDNGFSKIALPTQEGLSLYAIEDIITCSAQGPYTRIDFIKDKSLMVTGTLKEIEEKLPVNTFCRIHKSYLVNLNYIKKYYKGKGGYVEMVNGKTLEVSFRKRDEFLDRLRH